MWYNEQPVLYFQSITHAETGTILLPSTTSRDVHPDFLWKSHWGRRKALAFLSSNGKQYGGLNKLRHVKYIHKLLSSTSSVESKRPSNCRGSSVSFLESIQVPSSTVGNNRENYYGSYWLGMGGEKWRHVSHNSQMLQLLQETCFTSFAARARLIVPHRGVLYDVMGWVYWMQGRELLKLYTKF